MENWIQKFPSLSPAQVKAITLLANGETVTAAAAAADVDRTTIYDWKNTVPAFDAAIQAARERVTSQLWDELNDLSRAALARIRHLITDPGIAPAVSLKASLAMLNGTSWQAGQALDHLADSQSAPDPTLPHTISLETSQQPIRVTKIGRNQLCPCGSQVKYKRCCGDPTKNQRAA